MRFTRHALITSLAALLAVGVVAAATALRFPARLAPAVDVLGAASRPWLALALAAFGLAFACTVGSWRTALAASGGRLPLREAGARLAVGALVNACAPAKLGDAVKIALCARALAAPDRYWTVTGAYAALSATRGLLLAALVVAASATHALPIWPVFVLAGGAGAVALAAATSSRLRRHHRLASLLAAAARLARSPRAFAVVLGWNAGTQLARLAGAAAVAVAFGLPHPVLAALVILPALDVAGAIPLTPGSIGVGSGAVAMALSVRGIGMTQALAVGLAIQGVETLVSGTCGVAGLAYLAQPGPRVRRTARRLALVASTAAIAAAVGTILDLF